MNTEIKKLPECRVGITCEMPWEEFDSYRVRAIAVFSQSAKVPGFRPGKAPKEVIESGIGKEEILLEASKAALQEKFEEIVKKEGLEPIGRPKADILKLAHNNPFIFRIIIDVLPDIPLPNYKKIAGGLKQESPSATEKDVQDTLNWILRSRADFADLAREAKENDFVKIEYRSPEIESNKLFKDGFLLGKGGLVIGFEDRLRGMKSGEEKEFVLTVPENFANKTIAGKEACFWVKMEKVEEMKLPVLDDAFVKKLGKFENVEDLKKNISEGIAKEKKAEALSRWRGEALSRIVSSVEFDLPKELVRLEIERAQKRNGFENEEEQKTTVKQAEKRVKEFLCLRQIGKENSIFVDQAEIEQQVNKFLTNYPQEEIKKIDIDQLKEYYKRILFNEKVFKLLELCQSFQQ